MFLRVKTTPNSPRKAVQIVHSVRDGKKVRQRILRHVGIAHDEADLARLKDLGAILMARMEADGAPQLFAPEEVFAQLVEARRQPDSSPLTPNLRQLRETGRLVTGIHDVYGAVYEELGLDRILPRSRYRTSHQALFHCVMARLAQPQSKRASVRTLAGDFGVHLPLEKVYRMMDRLTDDRIARLQKRARKQAHALLGDGGRILFFDCTTLYFESTQADALKQPGYSKDGKHAECPVLLALVVTDCGLPVHYHVLPGASFEGHSLRPVVEALQREHGVTEAVVVADRGMMSAANLQALDAAGLGYIVGARLKSQPAALRAEILDDTGYAPLGGGVRVRSLALPTPGQRLIVRHSPTRAAKDQHDRERGIAKWRRKLGQSATPKALLRNSGYSRFLKVTGTATVQVDPEAVVADARWDGRHGVITNLPDTTGAATILDQYRGLWQVEETFRVTKHDLRVRPMFHWTPRRIRAHIAIAFMTLLCVRHLQYRVRLQQGVAMSAAGIHKALTHVQHSVLEDPQTGQRYAIPSGLNAEARKLYRVMGQTHDPAPLELEELTGHKRRQK